MGNGNLPSCEMNSSARVSENNTCKRFTWLLPLMVFGWPFIYLHPLILVFYGHYRAIGYQNDFITLYCNPKIYLLDNLVNFKLPLWSPAEAAGYPFYSNPYAQVFYPLNLPLALYYKILGGYTPLDHQIFTVLGVAIFALGLFVWLRLINSNLRAVVFATLVMSISFKVTEILRFPNAVHTAAWYPWILYSLTRIIFSRSVKDAVVSGVLLWFFLICLCTGAYPYYIYYSVFLLVPYLLSFIIRPLRAQLFGEHYIHLKRALITLMLTVFAAAFICVPYLFSIRNLMAQTTDRGGNDYNFAVAHIFNLQHTIGSLVYPLFASVEGVYFFSITALLIILLYFFTSGIKIIPPENQNNHKFPSSYLSCPNISVKIFFIIWLGLISYISYGRLSYLFLLLWKYMPGFSHLRVWPRLNIILVPILAWLLSLAYASFEEMVSRASIGGDVKNRWKKWAPLMLMPAVYGVILAVQSYFYNNRIDNIYCNIYWSWCLERISPGDFLFLLYGAVAFIVIMMLLTISRLRPFKSNLGLGILLIVLIAAATAEMAPVGTHLWTKENHPSEKRVCLNVAKLNELSFIYNRFDGYYSLSLGPNFSVGTVDNWYLNRYVSFLKNTGNELEPRRTLLGVTHAGKVFFSKSIEHSTVEAFLNDASQYSQSGSLLSYTGDELLWEIDAPVDGFLSFIDNWESGWKAFVDDKPAEIKLLFGTFKAVYIPAGHHRVRFFYRPIIFKSQALSN